MLRELQIKNFAVIDQAALELGTGLNVLTGETGAGKSIILNALGLISGGRAASAASCSHASAAFMRRASAVISAW